MSTSQPDRTHNAGKQEKTYENREDHQDSAGFLLSVATPSPPSIGQPPPLDTRPNGRQLSEQLSDSNGVVERNSMSVVPPKDNGGVGNLRFEGGAFKPIKVRFVCVVHMISILHLEVLYRLCNLHIQAVKAFGLIRVPFT